MTILSTNDRSTISNGRNLPPRGGRILVVDDHRDARASIAELLRHAGHQVDTLASAIEALRKLADESFDVILTDLAMPGMNGLEFMAALQSRPHGAQIIMVTAHASVATAVEAIRRGAFDYIEKPFSLEQLEDLVARALAHGRALDRGQSALPGGQDGGFLVGDSPAMRALRARIAQIAPTGETVLIHGESGTGKELVARSLHSASPRAAQALVSLNCPALSAHLMESELFGHEKGAFTGADSARTGRFELADGSSILLDEVTEIDLPLQAKLLRVLQEKSFERVGSSVTLRIDVRVLATTNRDLRVEAEAGRFRRDLYYRLAVLPIEVPPLRDRREDLPLLVAHFAHLAADRLQREPVSLTAGACELLANYAWPGNVRELENLITRASVLGGPTLDANELRPWLIDPSAPDWADSDSADNEAAFTVGLNLQEMERKLIEATLTRFGGHRAKAAAALGIGIRTLSGKLREYGYAPRAKEFAKTV
jgi:DNA-binding NtrC family response regulator